MTDEIIEKARANGELRATFVADMAGANEPERETIAKFERLVRHGVSTIDIQVRGDGKEYHFEGDWLARLFR